MLVNPLVSLPVLGWVHVYVCLLRINVFNFLTIDLNIWQLSDLHTRSTGGGGVGVVFYGVYLRIYQNLLIYAKQHSPDNM